MQKKISGRLALYLLCIFIFSTLFTMLVYQYYNSKSEPEIFGRNEYKSMENMAAAIWTLILTTGTLTVFLNLFRPVRNTILFSFLSFFLFPSALTFAFWYSEDNPATDLYSFYVNTIVFFAVLIFFYIRFVIFSRRLRMSAAATVAQ
ncbi:MAG: hypothetical protein ABJA78_04575 [Ferruginibacter sp.]